MSTPHIPALNNCTWWRAGGISLALGCALARPAQVARIDFGFYLVLTWRVI